MSTQFSLSDPDFRPRSYFWPISAEKHLLATIKGQERRIQAQAAIESGNLARINAFFLTPSLSAEDRQMFGRIHPRMMGGEYLPGRKVEEIEIARINIRSTTSDVTCVYARRGRHRIYYRVVDEYDGDTLSGRARKTSVKPLSQQKLIEFFLGAWDLEEVLECNELNGDEAQDFVRPSSEFYPDFASEIRALITQWRG